MSSIPRVAMNGGSFAFVTMSPLRSPIEAPVASPPRTATGTFTEASRLLKMFVLARKVVVYTLKNITMADRMRNTPNSSARTILRTNYPFAALRPATLPISSAISLSPLLAARIGHDQLRCSLRPLERMAAMRPSCMTTIRSLIAMISGSSEEIMSMPIPDRAGPLMRA